jgi:hypothetical protein
LASRASAVDAARRNAESAEVDASDQQERGIGYGAGFLQDLGEKLGIRHYGERTLFEERVAVFAGEHTELCGGG